MLEVAPGLSRGISFERQALQRLATPASRPGGVIDLRDILAQDDIVFDDDDDVADNDVSKQSNDVRVKDAAQNKVSDDISGPSFDDVIKV